MRLAVLSDIHGNLTALEAVLADLAQAGGADRTWFLGDLVTPLARPAECLARIRQLLDAAPESVEVIGGNTDRYLVTGQRRAKKPATEEAWQAFPAYLQQELQLHQYTLERLTFADAEYLQKILRRELAFEVPGYGWVIGCHGAPGNDETNMLASMPGYELLDLLTDSEGRLVFCGHTHQPMDKDLGRWRIVNVGSIGMPLDGDARACYALVNFVDGAAHVDLRRVAYDVEAACRDLAEQTHPAADPLAEVLRSAKMVN